MSKESKCMKRALKKGFSAMLALSLTLTGLPEIHGNPVSILAAETEEKTEVYEEPKVDVKENKASDEYDIICKVSIFNPNRVSHGIE